MPSIGGPNQDIPQLGGCHRGAMKTGARVQFKLAPGFGAWTLDSPHAGRAGWGGHAWQGGSDEMHHGSAR